MACNTGRTSKRDGLDRNGGQTGGQARNGAEPVCKMNVSAGNTKGGNITVLLTSCFTDLD